MKYFLMLVMVLSFCAVSCEKTEVSCFDDDLVHENACTQDCPGVVGCDGQTYCNECEANRVGISVE